MNVSTYSFIGKHHKFSLYSICHFRSLVPLNQSIKMLQMGIYMVPALVAYFLDMMKLGTFTFYYMIDAGTVALSTVPLVLPLVVN